MAVVKSKQLSSFDQHSRQSRSTEAALFLQVAHLYRSTLQLDLLDFYVFEEAHDLELNHESGFPKSRISCKEIVVAMNFLPLAPGLFISSRNSFGNASSLRS